MLENIMNETTKKVITHNLGFPRIGAKRELKFATEAYWKGEISSDALKEVGRELRHRHWALQSDAGIDFLPVGDFSFYDHVLDCSAMFGVVPPRFDWQGSDVDLDTYFRMARGRAPTGKDAAACEMTKWFDTNYHYLVPEFQAKQIFKLSSEKLFKEISEAQELGYKVKPVIVGPITYLWLGKCKGGEFDKLSLLGDLLKVYADIFKRLEQLNIEWVQLDESALVLDLPEEWKQAYAVAYNFLKNSRQQNAVKIMLATYFGALEDNIDCVTKLPIDALHIDAVRAPEQLKLVNEKLDANKILSVGIIDGRNIWRENLSAVYDFLSVLCSSEQQKNRDALWLAPSCSLLHVPVDLSLETEFDAELHSWLAFARQKIDEVVALKKVLDASDDEKTNEVFQLSSQAISSRKISSRIHQNSVKKRVLAVTDEMAKRSENFSQRIKKQQQWLKLPNFPTTTIGSFPQTAEIRKTRSDYKQGNISHQQYVSVMQEHIQYCVDKQEDYGLDVLVHGEAERNDMVEYFGEQLDGFTFSQFGWVQSYGSRCVKPPIIFGDVSRPEAMTVEWTRYAQSITDKPMKGMLTGPVTILNWSFVRDDQTRAETCLQIALALRDEVNDLEAANIKLIQIDEAALREGLPLRQRHWQTYLDWAVRAFCVSSSGVEGDTQIHTHMCYSEFNDIIQSIAAMDADVITIETSRSDMELLDAFVDFEYPNDIGPGVYDIHSPNVPSQQQVIDLMHKASKRIPAQRLWVNPDCGLKTRDWSEVDLAMKNMVSAAGVLREQIQ
ncbi:5-methyltetrahydropteroyltriglutamate--homocysteine methyltransferase [hydrothermal vent metagenome]|uniref:5-methyltetrahydropteroyltriglutamate--homocysteine S-methyltransferase n=1 Tax=hydrothermal vent metagenome TaxID=652676 RepID=A0A3B0X640_9ZZZZ